MDFAQGEEAAGGGRRNGDGLRSGRNRAEERDDGRQEAGKKHGDSLQYWFHVYKITAGCSQSAPGASF
jgi:hypothetical protein